MSFAWDKFASSEHNQNCRLSELQFLKLQRTNMNGDMQWGYIKFSSDSNTDLSHDEEHAILFVNNTRLSPVPGEESREVYYEVTNAELMINEGISPLHVSIHVSSLKF